MFKKPISLLTVWVLFALILILRIMSPEWGGEGVGKVLSWDVFGYYLYLPSWFIYDDITTLDWAQQMMEQYGLSDTFYQAFKLEGGQYVLKYSMGMSIFYMPFFFIAHLLAEPLGYAADGFSAPYQAAIGIGCTIYALLGLLVTRKILQHFFEEKVVIVVLVLLVLATNYLQFSVYKDLMAHMPGFLLLALVVLFTIRWHENPKWKYAVGIGLSIGVAALVRPSEGIALFIPLLWGVKNIATLKEKFALLWQYKWHFLLVAAFIFIGVLPQLIYWKTVAGSWTHWSYGDEGFFWGRPQIYKVLFSFRKGLFIYTPVMLLAALGMRWVWKQKREIFWPMLVFLLFNLYVISSWTIWWFAASFGHRAFVQSYAVMAIPLGFIVAAALGSQRKWIRTGFMTVLFGLIALNLFQHWQYHNYIIDPTRMTADYYWHAFGKTDHTGLDRTLLGPQEFYDPYVEYIRDESMYDKHVHETLDFEKVEDHLKPWVTTDTVKDGRSAFRMDANQEFSPGFSPEIADLGAINGSWVRLSVDWYAEEPVWESMGHLVLSFHAVNMTTKYRALNLDSFPHQAGQWNHAYLECIIPEPRYSDDMIKGYIWHPSQKPLYIDNLKFEVLNPRRMDNLFVLGPMQNMNDVSSTIYQLTEERSVSAPASAKLSGSYIMSPPALCSAAAIGQSVGEAEKAEVSAYVFSEVELAAGKSKLVMDILVDNKVVAHHEQNINWRNPAGEWVREAMIIDLPADLHPDAKLSAWVQHQGSAPLLVDDLQISFSKKRD